MLARENRARRIRRTSPPDAARAGDTTPLPTPRELAANEPCTPAIAAGVEHARTRIRRVLAGDDDRLVVVAGPCSIHDAGSALEYAQRLERVARACEDVLVVAMRVYLEKPRTRLGWKGIVNDPHMDGSNDVREGLLRGRQILRAITQVGTSGLPCASEVLDPLAAPYLQDLIAWGCIGARTAHSQPHRELASALPMPVGIKNGVCGDVQGAIDAVHAARAPHAALAIDVHGRACVRRSAGNRDAHVVLRGGRSGPNASPAEVEDTARALRCPPRARPVFIDCSHGNSGGDLRQQGATFRALVDRVAGGERAIGGLLLESHLEPGRQDWRPGEAARPERSVTDACLGWRETRVLLLEAAGRLRRRRSA